MDKVIVIILHLEVLLIWKCELLGEKIWDLTLLIVFSIFHNFFVIRRLFSQKILSGILSVGSRSGLTFCQA